MRKTTGLLLFAMLAGCGGNSYEDYENRLREAYSNVPEGTTPAYAIRKRGVADSWLATVHGYPNNVSVCEELIAPYNANAELSALPGEYYCERL